MTSGRSSSRLWLVIAALIAYLWCGKLAAHTVHSAPNDLLQGFLHPLSEPGHVLAALSLGAIARFAGREAWTIAASFVVSLCLGGVVAPPNLPPVAIEVCPPTSLLLLGFLLASAESLPTWFLILMVGAIGLSQGLTHGAVSSVSHFGVVVFGTATVIGAGALLASMASLLSSTIEGRRMAGITIALVGLLMLSN